MEPYGTPNSVALVTHGLNLRPGRLRPVVELLRRRGALTGIYTLPGHRGDWLALAGLRAEDAVTAAARVCAEVTRIKRERALPTARLVAHSLGALAFLTALAEGYGPAPPADRGAAAQRTLSSYRGPFDEAILLAPAVALRRRATLLRAAAMTLPEVIPIPSLAPRGDAVYSVLPLGAYRLLYELLDRFGDAVAAREFGLPMRLYLDPTDEFVSESKIRRLLRHGSLTGATLVIGPDGEKRSRPFHLLAGPASMGPTLWKDLSIYLK